MFTPGITAQRRRQSLPIGLDPHFANVLLLLHGEGTDASTTFIDSGPLGLTCEAVNSAEIDTSTFKYGTSSILTNGGFVQVLNSEAYNFAIGTNALTVEGYFKLHGSHDYGMPWCIGAYGSAYGLYGAFDVVGANVDVVFGSLTPYASVVCLATVPLAQFLSDSVHVAWVREKSGPNSIGKVFVNGVIVEESTLNEGGINVGIATPSRVRVGAMNNISGADFFSEFYYRGWIDDLRITKNVARYTSSFTPPTEAFPDS